MKQITLMYLRTKRNVFGKRAKGSPIPQPNRKTIGTHTTTFFEWATELNESSKAPKNVRVTMEQIADKFGVSREELIIN